MEALRSGVPSFSAIFNRKMQKLPLFSCILLRNEGGKSAHGVQVSMPLPSRTGHGFEELAPGSPAFGYHHESNMKYLIGIFRAAKSAFTCSGDSTLVSESLRIDLERDQSRS